MVWVAQSLATMKTIIDLAVIGTIQVHNTIVSRERLFGRFIPPASLSKEISGYRRATLERMQMQKTYFEILRSEKMNTLINVWSVLCP